MKLRKQAIIALYKNSDKQSLIQIFRQNIPKYFAPKELEDFIMYLDKHADTYFTVKAGDIINGGFGYVIDKQEQTGSITWIFFHPDTTGTGLGTASLNYCLPILKSNSFVDKITVRTSQHANLFFEKFGFNLIEIKKDYWGKDLDLYSMELLLIKDGDLRS